LTLRLFNPPTPGASPLPHAVGQAESNFLSLIRSIGLFETMGFEKIGVLREVGVKFGRCLDLVLLEKLL
jgi:phosphinothricin acetyltransferase